MRGDERRKKGEIMREIKEVENLVIRKIEGERSSVVDLLRRLVRASKPQEEVQTQNIVKKELKNICKEIDVWEPDIVELKKHPAFFPEDMNYAKRPNVVGIMSGSGEGKSMILNAHIDVVDPGLDAYWKYEDPWSGRVEKGKLYGRGACDDLSGVVAGLYALKSIKEVGFPLKGNIIFESVVDEEWGGGGTLSAVMRNYKTDGAIILEPSGLEINPANRGGQAFMIEISGKGVHPRMSYQGVSAIDKAMGIITALKNLQQIIQEDQRTAVFKDFPVFAPVTIYGVQAGTDIPKVPEKCIFKGLLGYVSPQSYKEARQQLEEYVEKLASLDPWLRNHPPEVSWLGLNKEPSETSVDHPLVKTTEECFEYVTGEKPKVRALPAGTDASFLTKYGGIPTILFGAKGANCHTSNEYVEIDTIITVEKVIAVTLLNWCS